jgi:hypothetical protein
MAIHARCFAGTFIVITCQYTVSDTLASLRLNHTLKAYDRRAAARTVLVRQLRRKECVMDEKRGQWMGVGIAIALALGAALGILLNNLALGIGVGIAIGTGLGAALSKRQNES